MGQPAVVAGDRISGVCPVHQVPAPSGTAPVTGLPFAGPLSQGLSTTVLIGQKPAGVMGSSGVNTPPHVGLHVSDPAAVPTNQQARVTGGSATVFMDGKAAAYSGCAASYCTPPVSGTVVGSAATVLIGA